MRFYREKGVQTRSRCFAVEEGEEEEGEEEGEGEEREEGEEETQGKGRGSRSD